MMEANNKVEYLIPKNTILAENLEEGIPAFNVAISDETKNFCVGMVDIVNSTKITAKLPQKMLARYYEIFLNYMANVTKKFGGSVVKNIGDSLLYYFPESCKKRQYGFMSCMECAFAMIEGHENVRKQLKDEGLPLVDYRISADYGFISLMKLGNSSIDIMGMPVNMCAKINRQAAVNGFIIGGDLYRMVKNFDDYYYKEADAFSIGLKNSYSIYSVRRKLRY